MEMQLIEIDAATNGASKENNLILFPNFINVSKVVIFNGFHALVVN